MVEQQDTAQGKEDRQQEPLNAPSLTCRAQVAVVEVGLSLGRLQRISSHRWEPGSHPKYDTAPFHPAALYLC